MFENPLNLRISEMRVCILIIVVYMQFPSTQILSWELGSN